MMSRTYARRLAAALICGAALAAVIACGGATRPGAAATPTASRRVLLADEIRGLSATNAYEAVQRLRPEWLRRRGQISFRDPSAGVVVVYLDGVRYGGPDALRNVSIEIVLQMEHLTAGDATTRFGSGHGGGAILVRTR